jgi:hypothetical protein
MWQTLLVNCFLGLLAWLAQRHDLRARVEAEVAERGDRMLLAAMAWGIAQRGDPVRFADAALDRLRDPGGARPRIVGVDPDPAGDPDRPAAPPPRPR